VPMPVPENGEKQMPQGPHNKLQRMSMNLASYMNIDIEAAKEMMHRALNGNEEACNLLAQAKQAQGKCWKEAWKGKHEGKRERPLVKLLTWITKMDVQEATTSYENALQGAAEAQAKIREALEASDPAVVAGLHDMKKKAFQLLQLLASGELGQFSIERDRLFQHWKGKGGKGKGKGKGCKGKGKGKGKAPDEGSDQGPTGAGEQDDWRWENMVVRRLASLGSLSLEQAWQGLKDAQAGSEAAQAQVGAVLEAVALNGAVGSETEQERYAIALLQMLACGDLDSFREKAVDKCASAGCCFVAHKEARGWNGRGYFCCQCCMGLNRSSSDPRNHGGRCLRTVHPAFAGAVSVEDTV